MARVFSGDRFEQFERAVPAAVDYDDRFGRRSIFEDRSHSGLDARRIVVCGHDD